MQGPPADEAESRAHWRRAVQVTLPQHTQGVGVIEGDASFVAVQAHSQPGRQRSRVDVSRVAVAAAVGVQSGLAVALCLALAVARPSGEQDLPHAHRQEAEGRGVLGFLWAAVMAAVWVTPGGGEKKRVI